MKLPAWYHFLLPLVSSRSGLAAPVKASIPNGSSNSSSCEWDGPNDFIDQALGQHLNVTDIVIRCPSTCLMLYGSGNSVCTNASYTFHIWFFMYFVLKLTE